MSVKVKICGIRSLEAAQAAIDSGADFLGFNFISTSKRYIDPSKALKIIESRRDKTKLVGVFQNADLKYVNNIAVNLNLDFVQLHGNEDNDYINNVVIPVIKYIKLDNKIQKSKAEYLLLDRLQQGKGIMVKFEKAAKLAVSFSIFYAGGLNPENVANVVNKVKPFAVDVAGGIETNGLPDIGKIKLFIKNAKEVA